LHYSSLEPRQLQLLRQLAAAVQPDDASLLQQLLLQEMSPVRLSADLTDAFCCCLGLAAAAGRLAAAAARAALLLLLLRGAAVPEEHPDQPAARNFQINECKYKCL
jgi:hypothetical protein